ncbi:MAG: SDR family oxidoreductase [Verrucomicrobia bacterium]|nr:SDR family oxidoreductase [Verrucomicrobiota bacterium]
MRTLIVGCGYVGLELGSRLAAHGHEVVGVRRSAGAEAVLCAAGVRPVVLDISRAEELGRLPGAFDWVVNCAAAGAGGGGVEAYEQVYLEGTRNLVAALRLRGVRRYVYTSSTGVYGQTDGSLVTESSETDATSPTGRVLLQTEEVLSRAYADSAFPATILRVAGIYGPGRGYWLRQFLAGAAVLEGEGQRVLNMIHRDDVAGAIAAALERGEPGEIYNAVDDEPVTQWALFQWLADRLGRPLPPAAPAGATTGANRTRERTSKRVSNRKLKTQLGYRFQYPTFREGYAAELDRG